MLNPVTPEIEAMLRERLPPAAFPAETVSYRSEPRGRWEGQGLVVAPGSTEEVAQVIRLAASARLGVVPYSGGTGLVGGQLMPDGPAPLILSLSRMTRIRAVHPQENVLVAEAGVILAEVQAEAKRVGRLFPLALASEGSARVGGVLAANAGGVNVLRYGNARALCLGIEAVTAAGEVWHGLTRLRKDNAGYDLRDLVIGSEGTLAVITAAALRLVPEPARIGAALLTVASPQAALDLLARAQDIAGDALTAFELIHRQGLDFMDETGFGRTWPLTPVPDWMVLVEVGLPEGADPQEMLVQIAAEAPNGVIAQSDAQRAAFWAIRETIPLANRRIGAISSHDISLPLSEIPAFIAETPGQLAALGAFRINCFGHLGDGNLHFNVFPVPGRTRADHENQREAIKRLVHDLVHARGGSVAAEHGVGRLKVADLERYADPVKLRLMRAVKDALDPDGILNPGAVLRAR